jgi:DNA-damage-inducible protein D
MICHLYQTKKQELNEMDYQNLSEDDKMLYKRDLTRKGNYSLNQTARNCGVKNFDKFHNAGYKGLYNGETADDIIKRKGLKNINKDKKKQIKTFDRS